MWQPTPELQEEVMRMARKWTRDDPSYKDDLYQEGMLAIWQKQESESPLSHQLRTARDRMISARKLGKSVDGKLNSRYRREERYTVLSMEYDGVNLEDCVLPIGDMLPDPFRVEQYVVSKLTLLELVAWLDPWERRCAALLCQGFTMKEIAAREGKSFWHVRHRIVKMRERIKAAIKAVVRGPHESSQ